VLFAGYCLDCKKGRLARFVWSPLNETSSRGFVWKGPAVMSETVYEFADGSAFLLLEALWNIDAPPCQFREQAHAPQRKKMQ
jgi:hypothetical protein